MRHTVIKNRRIHGSAKNSNAAHCSSLEKNLLKITQKRTWTEVLMMLCDRPLCESLKQDTNSNPTQKSLKRPSKNTDLECEYTIDNIVQHTVKVAHTKLVPRLYRYIEVDDAIKSRAKTQSQTYTLNFGNKSKIHSWSENYGMGASTPQHNTGNSQKRNVETAKVPVDRAILHICTLNRRVAQSTEKKNFDCAEDRNFYESS